MNWIYYFHDIEEGTKKSLYSKIYFRPTIYNEKGEHMSGNMFIFKVYALEYLMDKRQEVDLTDEQSKELYRVYFEHLKDTDYHFDIEWKPKGHEYYLHCAGKWYLKTDGFNEADLLEWVKAFMHLHGIPSTSFQKAEYGDFLDENPLIRSLQKAAREGENDK